MSAPVARPVALSWCRHKARSHQLNQRNLPMTTRCGTREK